MNDNNQKQDEPIKRVDVDLLEFDDYALYYGGEPFTGVGYEMRPDGSGKLWSEQTFLWGFPDGPSRSWYESGQLDTETYYRLNLAHGLKREWYPDGKPKSETLYDLGTRVERRAWNEQGALVEEFHIDPNSAEFKRLEAQGPNREEQYVRSMRKRLGIDPR